MKQQKQWLVSIAGALVALTINSVTWAGVVPLDNRLPAWEDYGIDTVDFTGIEINYSNGKRKRGITGDTEFFGESSGYSSFNLNGPGDRGTAFNGYLVIDANISSKGVLRRGGTFGIYSSDAKFGTGNEASYDCDPSGKQCTDGQLVYGGTLTGFGWSGSQGILEFSIGALHGWAVDTWNSGSMSEHIMLNTGAFSLNGVSSVHAFTATADGFAVVGNAYCGNGIIESSEECDDGNNVDGDGCSAFCVVEELP